VSVGVAGYSPQALSWSTRLVRAYADSGDGNVTAEVGAVLEEVGRDEAELRNLVTSLAGLAGHAVRAIAVRLDADLGLELDEAGQLPRLSEHRTKVLAECADALRAWADTRERRTGLDRRLAPDRRQLAPGNPKEQINLRLFGERRVGVADRRSGLDRRGSAGVEVQLYPSAEADARETVIVPDPRRPGVRGHLGLPPRARP
jgi:hypothetical protein